MKKYFILGLMVSALFLLCDCKKEEGSSIGGGMASVEDSTSQKNVVGIAVGSKDHTTLVAAVKAADQVIGMANGGNITVTVKDGKTLINGESQILASVPASNGIVHVMDTVLLPK
mgnify:CR=1 FL=1